MKLLFLAIQQYLLSRLASYDVTYIRTYFDQAAKIAQGNFEDFPRPAILVEFVSPLEIQQLGNGSRLYEPLNIRLHLIHEFYDAQDGTMGQNLDVLAFADAVYFAFQDWMPDKMTINNVEYQIPVGVMQIVRDNHDNQATQIYHFMQDYVTTWLDDSKNRPVGGSLSGQVNFELDYVLIWNNLSVYLAGVYVSYTDGNIYKCILDAPAGTLPINTTYFIYDRQIQN